MELIGWWLAPLAFSAACFGAAFALKPRRMPSTRPFSAFGSGLAGIFLFGCAIIASQFAWFIWAWLT
ncbi:MAG: hypothetical protein ACAH27_05570 [Xanthobacteraceae bacterium]